MIRDDAIAELAKIKAATTSAQASIIALEAFFRVDPSEERSTKLARPSVVLPLAGGLTKADAFYSCLRESDLVFGERLTPGQFAGIEADLAMGAGRLPTSWMAYALATDYHETGHSMQPRRERGAGDGPDADPWDDYLEQYDVGRKAAALGNTPEADGDGVLWMGRGKAQITGARNYRFANKRLHELGFLTPAEDLTRKPDLALRLEVATAILIFGALEGWFTTKTFNHYLSNPATLQQFTNARRIINGVDRAALIAGYAMVFQRALSAGRWV